MDKISIIVPCYNEEKVLPAFYRETAAAAMRSWVRNANLFLWTMGAGTIAGNTEHFSASDCRCKYISFSRNFGKEAAMYAGLENASGDYCVFHGCGPSAPSHTLERDVPRRQHRRIRTAAQDCAKTAPGRGASVICCPAHSIKSLAGCAVWKWVNSEIARE